MKVGHRKSWERGTQAVEVATDFTARLFAQPPRLRSRAPDRRRHVQPSRREPPRFTCSAVTQTRDQIVDLTEPPASPAVDVLVPELAQLALRAGALDGEGGLVDLRVVWDMRVTANSSPHMIRQAVGGVTGTRGD